MRWTPWLLELWKKEALDFLISPVSADTIILESPDTERMPIANKAMQADIGACPRMPFYPNSSLFLKKQC